MEILNKKLKLRSWRRGTKEMDLILGLFAEKKIDSLSKQELFIYEKLLECDDYQIYNWILDKERAPDHLEKIVKSLKQSLCS